MIEPKKSESQPKKRLPWYLRILLILVSTVFLTAGLLYIVNGISPAGIRFDSSFKFGIGASGFGLFFLIVAVRGKWRIMEIPSRD